MSFFSYNVLRSYYLSNPQEFVTILNGDSYISGIYSNLISQIVSGINSQFNSINSTVVRLDFDGNLILSNNDAIFAYTKEDIKKIPGSAILVNPSELFLSDAVNKRAIISAFTSNDFSETVQSTFSSSNPEITQSDIDFINASFSDVNIQINYSRVIWEYKSDRYITGFYLMPETREIEIQDGFISDASTQIVQNQEVTWVNNSSKPISIYSGTTNYNAFQSNPDLSMYGSVFKSGVLQPGDSYTYKFFDMGDYNWFIYPNILTAKITVTKNRINSHDSFLVTENDGLSTPFSSRVIKIDNWGNVLSSFGEGYLFLPRGAKPLLNGNILVST